MWEIGIRMALGARSGEVLRLVLQRSLLWVTGGMVIGVAIALSVGGITGQLLAGVSGTDPITFAASILPVHRAIRVDPIQALRYE